ncbi:MAG TPA: tRNA (N6-isopentenyl adenosine(37)-C2)-methylthiotransferase MiaB, partial [Oligoflexia bacterium]|nr:tRNA (N6-isopentenyl adenosine(37)-C2)-methylthiotransferase MiaB [Oligoflexia bacterium]
MRSAHEQAVLVPHTERVVGTPAVEDADTRNGLFVKTFGCQMNEYDSEKIALGLAGEYRLVECVEQAQVIIVNTCSVRDKAEQKLYSYVGSLARLKARTPGIVIGIVGCVAQQEGENVLKRCRHADFVAGTHNISLIPELVANARNGVRAQVAVSMRSGWEELPDAGLAEPFAASRPGMPEVAALGSREGEVPVSAFIAIQRGCSRKCAFCVVPLTRGPQVSRPLVEIEREVRAKAAQGAREVVLLGQTVNSYGRDLHPAQGIEEVIRAAAAVPGIKRIRFTSPHPAEMRRELIQLFGEIEQLCPHVHLPLQSGSDRILNLMRRSYSAARYLEIVHEFRAVRPDIAFSSDIIVGYPTESDEDFEMTLAMMKEVQFNSCFSFKYSVRPGTHAEKVFAQSDWVPAALASERLTRLQVLQDTISHKINQALI